MTKKEISGLNKLMQKLASREVIEKVDSDVSPRLEVVRVGDTLMLNAANTNYSFGGLHRVFQKVFKKVRMAERIPEDVLILGFGAGSIASILREELEIDCKIIGVEKDPVVIRLGETYFSTDRFKELKIIEADAAAFMASEKKTFDLIVVDVYVDFEVPVSCETEEFIGDLERCLRPGGMVVFNKLVYNHKAGEEATDLIEIFKSLPGKTKVIKVKETVVNKIVIYET
ncbi:MAG: hypothetical protein DRJ15_03860 [Bacteroidetes bacterium]|nr:MAG: hypothetical protein DRJ15_03860 [Bacteroidota bacterium]